MRMIDTGHANVSFVDDYIVVVEPKEGTLVDRNTTCQFLSLVEQKLNGDYSLIIDRKNKYKLLRIEVFNEDNRRNRLKSIAVVVYNEAARKLAVIEEPLSQKPFATFNSLDEAFAWVKTHHPQETAATSNPSIEA